MMPKFLKEKTCFADDGETVGELGWMGRP